MNCEERRLSTGEKRRLSAKTAEEKALFRAAPRYNVAGNAGHRSNLGPPLPPQLCGMKGNGDTRVFRARARKNQQTVLFLDCVSNGNLLHQLKLVEERRDRRSPRFKRGCCLGPTLSGPTARVRLFVLTGWGFPHSARICRPVLPTIFPRDTRPYRPYSRSDARMHLYIPAGRWSRTGNTL
jgi:hypothetical protein